MAACNALEVGPGVKVGAQVLKEYSAFKDCHVVVKTLLRYSLASSLDAYPGKILAEKYRFDRLLDSVRGGQALGRYTTGVINQK